LKVEIEARSCFVAQASLKLLILLPQPPKCWDCRYAYHHALLKKKNLQVIHLH
jgi:hypothetical protein